jgi:hypothetical protein
MSKTITVEQKIATPGRTILAQKQYSGELLVSLDGQQIPDQSTDLEVVLGLDVSEIIALFIKSDQALKIETNSGSVPGNTIDLLANQPYVWVEGDYDACKLTVDVTSLFLTNTSGATATLDIEALVDPTPA